MSATVLFLCLFAPLVAGAQSNPDQDAGAFDAEFRSLFGRQSTRGASVHSLSLGFTVLGSPSFQYHARLAAFTGTATNRHEEGLRESRDVTDLGLGGEFVLRIVPWPSLPVRPTLGVSAGAFGLPISDFLPGGARYVFQQTASLGLEFTVGNQHDLRLEIVQSHFSNGQGLNEGNPALDAFGVALGWAPMRTVDVPDPAYPRVSPPPLTGEPRLFARLSAGVVEELLLSTAGASAAWGATPNTTVQFDAEGGSLGGLAWGETGVAFRSQTQRLHGVLRVAYRRFAGINIWPLLAQLELELAPDVSLVAAGVYERTRYFGSAERLVGGLRAWPLRWLGLEGGWVATGTSGPTDHSAWFLAEAMLPWTSTRSRLAFYAGRQPSLVFEAGLRLSVGAGGDLRGRDRDMTIRALR